MSEGSCRRSLVSGHAKNACGHPYISDSRAGLVAEF
jgi:hypothetical protein